MAEEGVMPRWTADEIDKHRELFVLGAGDVNITIAMLRQAAEAERTLATVRELCEAVDIYDDLTTAQLPDQLLALLPPAGTR